MSKDTQVWPPDTLCWVESIGVSLRALGLICFAAHRDGQAMLLLNKADEAFRWVREHSPDTDTTNIDAES
ncbi:MAG: hypothetical protein M0Z43_13520 [Acidithiobacillus sp.]|nr:hypothetical protein [Acidithiobacillus sp.]